jgi:DNA-binding transcriptional MocR family regulator
MTELKNMRRDDLEAFHARIMGAYEAFRARRLNLNLTRGKPSPEQLDLSNELLRLPDNGDFLQADGGDTRNYFGSLQGLLEARVLFSEMLGAPPEQIVIGNNSSLAMMHDCIVYGMLKGLPNSQKPWAKDEPITFLCPAPGYDRHFAICETYGIRMIAVPMTESGPDMDKVEQLVADPSVRGMWCVPKYSNPDGVVYSREVVGRIAKMRTGAADFRVFWDNAYGVHHLTDVRYEVANILDACRAAGNTDRAFVFASTSKITFAGGGLALFASSPLNVGWLVGCMSKRTIGPDKLNQLRHVRFLKNGAGIHQLMEKHRQIIVPKFAAVENGLSKHLDGTGVATWTRPAGGYFISVNLLTGSARRVVELANQAGLALVPAGASFPYGRDPRDGHLRIAPTFPSVEEVSAASDGIGLSILLGAIEEIRASRKENA